jgi:hypothetical protein
MDIRRLTVLAALTLFVAVCAAQEDKAVLIGTVTDPSQAVMTGATVEINSKTTGFRRAVKTNEFGSYYLGGIPIGVFDLTVTKDGFQVARFESIQLVVGQIRTINVDMHVATSAQEVNVRAAADPLSESSANVGGVILNQQVARSADQRTQLDCADGAGPRSDRQRWCEPADDPVRRPCKR